MRFKTVLTAIVAALLFAGFGSGPAQAVAGPTDPLGPVNALGVGVGTHTTIWRASLFQCPFTYCNQGEASPPDDVATICYLRGGDGTWWDWVLNHANGHTGFIPERYLTVDSGQPCSNVGVATHVTLWRTSLFQCPSVQCNQGEASPPDDVTTVCWWPLNSTYDWNLVLNHANLHVGFVSTQWLTSRHGLRC